MYKQLAIIVNPVAGRGRGKKIWPQLASQLDFMGLKPDVYFTTRPGEAGLLALRAQEKGSAVIILVGGDGTIHEVINKIYFNKSKLAVIPTGTGNDFCRSAGIPLDPLLALQVLKENRVLTVDLGRVGNSFFINGAGVGFDAEVARVMNNSLRFLGRSAYLVSVMKVLASYKNAPVEITIDGHVVLEKALFVAVGNGCYIGGGMKINPEAQLDDGALDLCIAGNASKTEILKTLPKIFNGTHVSHPLVSCLRAREITINSHYPLSVHADGEIIGQVPATFDLLPRAVEVLVPRQLKAVLEERV